MRASRTGAATPSEPSSGGAARPPGEVIVWLIEHRRTAALYSRSLRHRRCHNVVTTRCEFGELTADGMRRFPLVRSVRESFREYSLPASVARVVRQAKSVVARLATRQQLVPQLEPVEHGLQARVERSPIDPLLPPG